MVVYKQTKSTKNNANQNTNRHSSSSSEFFTSSHFGCETTDLDLQIQLTPEECRTIITTGRFHHKEFTMENINPNFQKTHHYYSKGHRLPTGECSGVQFSRHGKIYKKSYEHTIVTMEINQMALRIEPSHIHQHTDDAILPFGFREPARHQNATNPILGMVIWDYNPPGCPIHGEAIRGYQSIYKGKVDVKLKTTATVDDQYDGALLSATNKRVQTSKVPQSFALAIHANISLCGQLAYSTNIEEIVVIFLKHGQEGIKTNETFGLNQPHLMTYKSQVTAQFINSNQRIDSMAERMYQSQCATEIKTIRNFLRIASATIFPSLHPHFGDGYTAVKGGAVIHVIKCKAVKVAVDTTREGCFEELPITKPAKDKKTANQTLWAHPITKIIIHKGTPATCSQDLPLMYKLTGGTYLCQDGTGLHRCKAPQLFIPNEYLPDFNSTHEIHKILGTGILSKTRIKALATRIYEPFFRETLISQMVIRNTGKPSFNASTTLEPIGSTQFIDMLTNSVSFKVTPMYQTLGNAYFHIMALFTVVAICITTFGIFTRILWETKNHGWTPRIILVLFNSVWQASRMPMDLLKNTVKGANDNALKSNMAKVIDPLQLQVNQLRAAIDQYQAQQQQQHRRGKSLTPPPKYHLLQDGDREIPKEEACHQNSDPKDNDTPNFYPNLHHPMNRRRSLVIPPNTSRNQTSLLTDPSTSPLTRRRTFIAQTSIGNQAPIITEVTGPTHEEFDIEDDIQQIPPSDIRSASSLLRDNLAHLVRTVTQLQEEEGQHQTRHQGHPLRLRQLPTQPDLNQFRPKETWHTTWHPPMPFPPPNPPPPQPQGNLQRGQTRYQPTNTGTKTSVTRYPRGSRADQPTNHNGFTVTRQTFTTPYKWQQHQTIFLQSDEEDEPPTEDPLAIDNNRQPPEHQRGYDDPRPKA